MSRTRIVATIGPISNNVETLNELRDAGMSLVRLNGSHGTLDWHESTISMVRKVLPDVPILLDIPGRKIRTMQLAHEPSFIIGDTIVLTTDTNHDGSMKIPVSYPKLHEDIQVGATILADDGTLRFTVKNVSGQDIECRAETNGQLKSRKGINVPFVKLRTQMVTARDQKMVDFACRNGVDFIGISFVESAEHVERIRALTDGEWPRVVSKIENQGGLENMEEIIDASDAIMIDRGDLSVETRLEDLAVFQKRILKSAISQRKPCIVATEMLHTMIENPFPTKAEVSDISNAVLDGAAATMLSGETAVGSNAVDAVRVMRQVSESAEAHLQDNLDERQIDTSSSIPQVMGEAVALVCRSLPISKIVAVTISGFAARSVAAHSPRQPIIAISSDAMAARSFNLLPGTTGIHIDTEFPRDSTNHIPYCLEQLWLRGLICEEDLLLVTAVAYPKSGNRMNLIQTHAVRDLADTLGWKR